MGWAAHIQNMRITKLKLNWPTKQKLVTSLHSCSAHESFSLGSEEGAMRSGWEWGGVERTRHCVYLELSDVPPCQHERVGVHKMQRESKRRRDADSRMNACDGRQAAIPVRWAIAEGADPSRRHQRAALYAHYRIVCRLQFLVCCNRSLGW